MSSLVRPTKLSSKLMVNICKLEIVVEGSISVIIATINFVVIIIHWSVHAQFYA